MKQGKTFILATMILALLVPAWAQRGSGRNMKQQMGFCNCQAVIASIPKQDLDATEIEQLAFLREEEKLARDVYTELYAQWGTPIFNNISQSEQRHFDALQVLLERYGLTDPASNNEKGYFQNSELQTLYSELVSQGETSLSAALRVGATIEDLDIHDLNKALASTDNDDLKTVYQNLLQGSQNHIRAFVGRLEAIGESYEAQYISAAELTEILAKPDNAGNGNGRGRNRQRRLGQVNNAGRFGSNL